MKGGCPYFCLFEIYNIAGEAEDRGMNNCMAKQATSNGHAYDYD